MRTPRFLLPFLALFLILIPLVLEAQTAPAWQVGTHYSVGAQVIYAGSTYKCLQAHTAQADWAPSTTPSLWQVVSGGGGGGCSSLPGVPSGLTASSTSSTGTALSWAASTIASGCSVTGYTVYQNGVSIGSTAGTNFVVSGLSPTTTYSFAVSAGDSFGSSAQSSPISMKTQGGGSGSCNPSWSAGSVYTGGMKVSAGGANYTANWWTQGQNPATNSGPSGSGQPWTITGTCAACAAVPSAPTAVIASGTTGTSTTLTWTAATAPANCTVTGYTILKNGSAIGTTTGTNFVAAGLSPSTTYSFTVTATDPFGSSVQSAPVNVTTGTSSGGGGGRLFAPYIDMSMTADQDLLTIQQQSGIKTFTLAFIISNGTCTPSWGGVGTVYNDTLPNGTSILSLVQGVRNAGGDVIVSFGGANGTELAQACADVPSLTAAYQAVVTRYSASMVDFDIEGGAVADQASVTRRDKALVALKAANPGLLISYTLPVLPTGLVADGINILNSVKRDGLSLDVVNVMAMDYGVSVDNNGQMGLNAAQAASSTRQQILAAGLASSVGITPMIGVNDVSTEVFQLADAQTLLNFAQANSYVSRIAMWSVARDNGSCSGVKWASATCSGVAQSIYQFSTIFEAFR